MSSFVGFAPADDPKYVILMTVNEPSAGAYYGSIVSAPYVGQVFKKIFDCETDFPFIEEEIREKVTMPNLDGKDYAEAVKTLKELGLYFEHEGEGNVVTSTLPIVGETLEKGDVVLIRT